MAVSDGGYSLLVAYQREDIERVRAATNLVELVGEVTKVKRSGRNAMAVCPFHQEKTPSLSVDAARGLYNCFGCGESGDLFKFVEQTQAVSFNEAVELLARRAGIALRVDPQAKRRQGEREPLIAAVEEAVEFYHARLRKEDDAAAARKYLRGRGYDSDVVDQFQLGFSPAVSGALIDHLRDKKVPDKVMLKAGLAGRGRGGGMYDRFRGRVMFPIYDLRGDAVGFGARLLEGEGPKYLNSAESPIYHKSHLLYGLNWAKSNIVRQGRSIVVEGYTDVIALHQAGLPLAVATCGTAFGESHLDLLRRFSDQVVLAFDADEAGAGAARRGFEHAVPGDLDLRVALLPPGRDPGDLAESGDVDTLTTAVEKSVPLLQFRLETELVNHRLDEPEARSRAVKALAAIVARHPDPVARHEYAVMVSRKSGVDLSVVEGAVARASRSGSSAAAPVPALAVPEARTGRARAEREYLRLMLANHPDLADVDLSSEIFQDELHRESFEKLAPALAGLMPGAPPQLGELIGDDSTPVGVLLRQLALMDQPLADVQELADRLEVWRLEREISGLRPQLDVLDPDSEVYSQHLQELVALEESKRKLLQDEQAL